MNINHQSPSTTHSINSVQQEYLKALAKAIYATTSKALQYQRVLAPVQKTALLRAVALGVRACLLLLILQLSLLVRVWR